MKSESVLKDLILTILTLGLFNLYVQFRQIDDCNLLLKKEEFSFIKVFILTILTLGLYFMYYEYKMTLILSEQLYGKKQKLLNLWVLPATFIGIWPAVDAYQQALLNCCIEDKSEIPAVDKIILVALVMTYSVLLVLLLGLLT